MGQVKMTIQQAWDMVCEHKGWGASTFSEGGFDSEFEGRGTSKVLSLYAENYLISHSANDCPQKTREAEIRCETIEQVLDACGIHICGINSPSES